MIGSLVIAFREVIEAGLIVGIVLAATRGIAGRGRAVALGVLGGLVGASLVALFVGRIANAFDGVGQELLNAAILLVAVAMLVWHNVHMSRHGREMARDLAAAGQAIRGGERTVGALGIAVGAAILREVSELVLFLYGLVAAGTGGADLLAGAGLGIALGVAVSCLGFLGLVAIPTRTLFSITSVLIALLAAGMAAQAVQFLSDAGVVTAPDGPVWNTSRFVSDGSLGGKLLKVLIGYTDRPSLPQLLAYGATLALTAALTTASRRRPGPPTPRPA